MKYTLFFSLLISGILLSCQKPGGLLMETANTIQVYPTDTPDSIILKAAHVVPTKRQYAAMKDEFIAFIHYGPNSFTQKEWGNGMEDPTVFNPQKNIDTDQWCEAIKAAGMTKVILTAKHHDGFVLWQSRYTKHGIMSSPYQNGKGDIMKALSRSCEKYGLKLAIYLSPADLYQIENPEGLYGNLSEYTERTIPRPVEGRPFENTTTFKALVDDYNEYFMNQLFELLTEYGPVHEVWFDGAHPKRKGGQKYNYLAWKALIRTLAPDAVIFGKEDIRWCGNEDGGTRETEWNVIPYQEDPNTINMFSDLMDRELGEKDQLVKGRFLHYQPAETNTSIREGWFYRDTNQKVRSADDVFDMYERAVGGNSIFLLNMPPNREGLLPQEDVQVLKEVGQRIESTYGTNLFEGARGPKKVLDSDPESFVLLDEVNHSFEINTKSPVTINRIVLQEDVKSHGERVTEHMVEAYVNGEWQELARSTNIGYKRILRFSSVTSNKFRFRVLGFRYYPAISNITAHYCEMQAPQLEVVSDANGLVTIRPRQQDFNWNSHGLDPVANLVKDMEIRFTTDGSEVTQNSDLFTSPVQLESKTVKAKAFIGDRAGAEVSKEIGLIKKDWILLGTSSREGKYDGALAFDGNAKSFWLSKNGGQEHFIAIDLGEVKSIRGFAYTPQTYRGFGMIQRGRVEISRDGKKWTDVEAFEFGNLINMPTTRNHFFEKPVKTRYIRIKSIEIAGESQEAAIAELDLF